MEELVDLDGSCCGNAIGGSREAIRPGARS